MAKQDTAEIMTPITRRERQLREDILQIDDDLQYDIDRLKKNAEARRIRLTKKVNKVRECQVRRLDRRDSSRIYQRSHVLYYALLPVLTVARWCKAIYARLVRTAEKRYNVTHHRSFYLTKRGDCVRRLNIASTGTFMAQVARFIFANWRIYVWPWIILSIILFIVIGIGDNENYVAIRDAMAETNVMSYWQQVAGMVVTSTTGVFAAVGGVNQFILAVTIMLAWLILIYISRHVYSGGNKLTFRRACYESGAPIIPMLCIILVILLQALPMVLVTIGYVALSGSMFINQSISIENMSATLVLVGVLALTIYWMSASLVALIVVTIPGMYPVRALYEGSSLIAGRRIKVLWRLLAMVMVQILALVLITIPLVMLDIKIKFNNIPIVQLLLSFVSGAMVVWTSVYLYLLYRRLIDSPEMPIGSRPRRQWWSVISLKKRQNLADSRREKAHE